MGGKPRAKPGVVLWVSRETRDGGVSLWGSEPTRKYFGAGYYWFTGSDYTGRLYESVPGVEPGQCRRVRVTVELLEDDDNA